MDSKYTILSSPLPCFRRAFSRSIRVGLVYTFGAPTAAWMRPLLPPCSIRNCQHLAYKFCAHRSQDGCTHCMHALTCLTVGYVAIRYTDRRVRPPPPSRFIYIDIAPHWKLRVSSRHATLCSPCLSRVRFTLIDRSLSACMPKPILSTVLRR